MKPEECQKCGRRPFVERNGGLFTIRHECTGEVWRKSSFDERGVIHMWNEHVREQNERVLRLELERSFIPWSRLEWRQPTELKFTNRNDTANLSWTLWA